MTLSFTPDQQARLQSEVQGELERREWAEPDDNVMAEYITVLLANGNPKEKVQGEMHDLVGSDFDVGFLDWLFSLATEITTARPPPQIEEPVSASSGERSSSMGQSGGRNRLLNTALGGLSQAEKRKAESHDDGGSRKRMSDGVPSGPKGMSSEGRSLAGRIGNRGPSGGGGNRGMPIRGMGRNGGGQNMGMGMNGMGGGFRQGNGGMMQPGFGFYQPGQQEMMAQMMMMQANMQHMGEMMHKMSEERAAASTPATSARPPRPPPAKIPHGTKIGSHTVSHIPPKRSSSPGPIPDKPTSKALCKFSVGCSNSRCPFSHPSPVADEKNGMVLSEEPCEEGKNCKDPECVKSHVSPAATLGNNAGPSRMLCKYQNCTNPSCAFRHEDEKGNPIPPPALTREKANKEKKKEEVVKVEIPSSSGAMSDGEDGEVEVVVSSKSLMDGALEDNARVERPCRYAERCTRPDCKFTHPASRPTPRGAKGFKRGGAPHQGRSSTGGTNISKKFGSTSEKKLDPAVSEFKPSNTTEVST